jgi:hypothetical protein
VTFAELGLTTAAGGASLGTTADIDGGLDVGFGLAESVSSSGGVGGKYSKRGESMSRAREAIKFIQTRGDGGDGPPKLNCSYMREKARDEISPNFLLHFFTMSCPL